MIIVLALLGVGAYWLWQSFKRLFLVIDLNKYGKTIELKPFHEKVSTLSKGKEEHILQFKDSQFITEKNREGIVECLDTKVNRKTTQYYDHDKVYSLKYDTKSNGDTYLMFNQSIIPAVLKWLYTMLVVIVIFIFGLRELRFVLYYFL